MANLGTAGLRGLILQVDWEHERFALTGDAHPPALQRVSRTAPAGQAPRFGVQAHPAPDGTLEVVGTDPGSPAEAIGLLAGDRIVAINGNAMTELPPTQIRAELAKPGLALTVERDGKTVQLK